ncbi:MAG: hypothetical protein M3Y72_06245 [Acidobacteriota bacterium]|nr:hypothetical protein [Acidobacteriota bacterium]
MADNSRSQRRSKQKLEPISIAELAGDSTMTGFSDLFKIPTSDVQSPAPSNRWKRPGEIAEGDPLLRRLKTVPRETAGPVSTTDPSVETVQIDSSIAFADTDGPETSPGETNPPVTTLGVPDPASEPAVDELRPETVPADTGGFETGPLVSRLQRKLQIRPAKLVQHGHTYGEQRVYEALWDHGHIVSESLRVITVGFLKMSGIAGLAESNCKAAVAGLIDKLAIERLPDTNLSLGRTYRVYAWKAVLKRREALGLTHVIKSRGVVFVNPETGQRLTTAKTQPRRVSEASATRLTGGPVSSGPVSFTRQVSSTAVTNLATRLRNEVDVAFDDSAAGRLWRECQSLVPDCTTDEVIHFVGLKAQRIYRDRKILNPIGLLLMSVPDYFSGGAVAELREQKGREEQQTREMAEQQQSYWRRVANDPSTSPEERELALRFVGQIG